MYTGSSEGNVQALLAGMSENIAHNTIGAYMRTLDQGSYKGFQQALADYCSVKYAVAVCNGTAALHLANLAIGTDKSTKAILPPITFLSTANSIIYAGGQPIFSDINH